MPLPGVCTVRVLETPQYLEHNVEPRGTKKGGYRWTCGPDWVPFRPIGFINDPFLFENWFRHRSRFSMLNVLNVANAILKHMMLPGALVIIEK